MKTHSFKRMITFMCGMLLLVVGISLIFIGLFVNKDSIITNEDKLLIENEKAEELGLLYTETYVPPTTMVFHGDSETEIGMLDWTDGKFTFTGNADESAKVFFKYFLKPYIDEYIEEELRRDDYVGVEFVSEDYEKNKTFLMRVTTNGEEVGIVYFDKYGVIRFRGDKELFEASLLKLLKARYGKEKK